MEMCIRDRIPIRVFEKLSFHGPIISCQKYQPVLDDDKDYLNNNHHPWKISPESDIQSTESFVELFEKAKRHSRDILESLDGSLAWGISPDSFLTAVREDSV